MSKKDQIKYTLLHRRAIKAIIDIYCPNDYKNELYDRQKDHDMDKVVMNLIGFPFEDIKRIHRLHNTHHYNEGNTYTKADYIEMIIDWESARYTKDDKPFNAYDTLVKFYPNLTNEIAPILKEMNLYTEDNTKNEEVVSLINYNITDQDIQEEINKYLDRKLKNLN